MNENQERAIKNLIGEELYEDMKEKGFDGKYLLHLYHTSGRPSDFDEKLKYIVFEEYESTPIDKINDIIHNLKEQIEVMEKTKRGYLEDKIEDVE